MVPLKRPDALRDVNIMLDKHIEAMRSRQRVKKQHTPPLRKSVYQKSFKEYFRALIARLLKS